MPKALVNLYGLIAVLAVIIPEWLAELAIAIGSATQREALPKPTSAWEKYPELRLASMNIKDLRNLAKQLNLNGYSNEDKASLSRRLRKPLLRQLQQEQTN